MSDALAALVLAAGEGKRLRPLTELRPKPLCPVGDTTLLDLAMSRVGEVVAADAVAINAHHLAGQIVAYVGDRAHVSVEQPQALGTAGAVGEIRDWLHGRDVLIANGDVYFDAPIDLTGFVDGWDRERPRLLVIADDAHPDFVGGWRFAGVSLLPAAIASALKAEPTGLYEVVWRNREIDLVATDASYIDCADAASYLAANLMASGGESVIGAGATVLGEVVRCVVWPDATVHEGERLVAAIRARNHDGTDLTVTP